MADGLQHFVADRGLSQPPWGLAHGVGTTRGTPC